VKDTFNAPDKGIPLSVLDGTKCVIVIPDLKKAAFKIDRAPSSLRTRMTTSVPSDEARPLIAEIKARDNESC
jgi:hypothetical protein